MSEYNVIETERLRLTSWQDTEEDAQGLYNWASDPKVGPNAGWRPHKTIEDSREIIRNVFLPEGDAYAIREKDTGEIIGNISVFPDTARENVSSMEVGYALKYECWGRGYMTEAVKAIMDYAFEKYNLVIMAVRTSEVNARSQRVIEKCGFRYEGTLRKAYHIYTGEDRDSRIYSITREEWEKRNEE